jgi:hypothetical protein
MSNHPEQDEAARELTKRIKNSPNWTDLYIVAFMAETGMKEYKAEHAAWQKRNAELHEIVMGRA